MSLLIAPMGAPPIALRLFSSFLRPAKAAAPSLPPPPPPVDPPEDTPPHGSLPLPALPTPAELSEAELEAFWSDTTTILDDDDPRLGPPIPKAIAMDVGLAVIEALPSMPDGWSFPDMEEICGVSFQRLHQKYDSAVRKLKAAARNRPTALERKHGVRFGGA
jgi:hypothetical protein